LKEVSDKEDLTTRFLLGGVDEDERAEVEDRLLSDEAFYERLLAAEGDLMDSYVRGELPAPECAQFEKSFFSSARRRERVEFARGLAESTTLLYEEESTRPRATLVSVESAGHSGVFASLFAPQRALRYAFAAAVLLVLTVVVWLAIERMRARVEPQQARTEGAAPSPQVRETPPSQQPGGATPDVTRSPEPERQTPPARAVFATITLTPGALRDGAAIGNLVMPPGATQVRLRLELEGDDYQSYRAAISTPEGRRVWNGVARKDRAGNAQSVTLTLPAAALKRGDYIVELSGADAGGRSEPAAQYSFRVSQNRLQ
jgi:hypothetical protein